MGPGWLAGSAAGDSPPGPAGPARRRRDLGRRRVEARRLRMGRTSSPGWAAHRIGRLVDRSGSRALMGASYAADTATDTRGTASCAAVMVPAMTIGGLPLPCVESTLAREASATTCTPCSASPPTPMTRRCSAYHLAAPPPRVGGDERVTMVFTGVGDPATWIGARRTTTSAVGRAQPRRPRPAPEQQPARAPARPAATDDHASTGFVARSRPPRRRSAGWPGPCWTSASTPAGDRPAGDPRPDYLLWPNDSIVADARGDPGDADPAAP